MCGRFLLDSDIEDIIRSYRIYKQEIDGFDKGDFYPSQRAPIVLEKNERSITLGKWGFPLSNKKGIVINARSEAIMDKPMFRDSIRTGRCIIPANLFYEWKEENKEKIKYKISLEDRPLISLAGIYKYHIDQNSNKELNFVIITTEANENMKTIHSRMPLIIEDNMVDVWLGRDTTTKVLQEILNINIEYGLKIERCEDDKHQQLRMF